MADDYRMRTLYCFKKSMRGPLWLIHWWQPNLTQSSTYPAFIDIIEFVHELLRVELNPKEISKDFFGEIYLCD